MNNLLNQCKPRFTPSKIQDLSKKFSLTSATLIIALRIIPFCLWNEQALAKSDSQSQVGTVAQIQGTVKLFTHPSRALARTVASTSGSPHALFEGEYYAVEDAKLGSRVEAGNILRTSPGSKARILFDNGDQFNIGSATAYRVNWSGSNNGAQTQVDLKYGKIRGIIEKGGPRSHLQIRTKTAVMGVRGTDFFIAQGGADNGTHVSIIRGAVELAPIVPPKKTTDLSTPQTSAEKIAVGKPIQVSAGFSAEMDHQVNLRRTTQEDYVGIQKSSTIDRRPASTAAALPSPEVLRNLASLEKSATKVVLQDIKREDKALYATLAGKLETGESTGVVSIDDINRAALQNLAKDAPKAPPAHKPYKSEIEDLETGAYDRYYKEAH